MFRIVEDLVSFALKNKITDPGNFVKKTFNPHLDTENLDKENFLENFDVVGKRKAINKDIYFQIDDYIRSKENKVSKGMIPVYKQLKERLKAFEIYRKKLITFDCLDYNFYEEFIEFLTFSYPHKRRKELFLGLKVNTIGLTVKQLRVFINDRVRRKIVSAIDLHDFKITAEETDAIYLTYDEVRKIYETDLSDFEYLKEYRNLFVLACLTGLRFSDFSTLKPEDLRKDMLYKKQNKSDHWVVIPLRKEAKELFTQHFKEKISALTNAEFNRHIKTIGKLAGINQKIKFSFKKGNRDVNSQEQTILLSQFAEVNETLGETTLQRIDRLGSITVQANVAGRPTGTVSDEIRKKLEAINIPDGISIDFLGDSKNQRDAFGSLGLALVTAILLVYLIMVALYENAVYPFVVLFSIPVALVGAFLALAITMETLNIFTIIGMIMLLGLVAKNAILIVDFTNNLKAEGYAVKDALVEAGKERLRPILMTTLAMILGMLPIAIASGAASEIKNGMAWVIIGGLTSSMILTLFVVPGMYLIIENLIQRISRKKKESAVAVS